MAQTIIARNDPKAIKKWAGDRELVRDVLRAAQEYPKKKKKKVRKDADL